MRCEAVPPDDGPAAFPALDIDVDDPELAEAIHREAVTLLGVAPARFGRGARRILVYVGFGLSKQRLAFRRTGDADAPVQAVDGLGLYAFIDELDAWQRDPATLAQ